MVLSPTGCQTCWDMRHFFLLISPFQNGNVYSMPVHHYIPKADMFSIFESLWMEKNFGPGWIIPSVTSIHNLDDIKGKISIFFRWWYLDDILDLKLKLGRLRLWGIWGCYKCISHMKDMNFPGPEELLWVKLCPQKDMFNSLFLVTVNVTLFGNKVIADVN